MNNEIGRKLTSLTLMTIMIAGGLTFAAPGVMPAAHAANANLFVSAENSQFDNYMSGPQVIEVVVIDSDIDDTDQAKGEPDVTVNGKVLRMAQAVDGNWYGYFADKNMAILADGTATTDDGVIGAGLDFGSFCSKDTADDFVGVDLGDTSGVAIPTVGGSSGTSVGRNGTTSLPIPTDFLSDANANCDGIGSLTGNKNGTDAMHVLREAKDLNVPASSSSVNIGQIGVNGTKGDSDSTVAYWPFIQLYSLNPTGNVIIQYNRGGGVQTTTLTFDTVDQFAGASLDRSVYPQNAEVHLTVTDLWLNIDPTDEDSWTFGANASNSKSVGTYYQVFDENGQQDGDGTTGAVINIKNHLDDLMCEDNCRLLVDVNAQNADNNVLTLQDNDDTVMNIVDNNGAKSGTKGGLTTGVLSRNSLPVTITEQGPNSGIFGTYDESDKSVIKITSDAARGTSATIDYNETPTTILVGFDFATVDIQPTDDEWNSGEEIPVVIVDGDANKNSRADEDMDLFNADVELIPSLKTGDPFTLGETSTDDQFEMDAYATKVTKATLVTKGTNLFTFKSGSAVTFSSNSTLDDFKVDKFSKRAIFSANATANGVSYTDDTRFNTLLIDLETTAEDLKNTFLDTRSSASNRLHGFNLFNLDIRSLNTTGSWNVYLVNGTGDIITDLGSKAGDGINASNTAISIVNKTSSQSLTLLNGTDDYDRIIGFIQDLDNDDKIGLLITNGTADSQFTLADKTNEAIVADFFSFGFLDDGAEDSERIQNQIIRIEAEETGDNTSTFEGTLEYIMINQLNVLDSDTYTGMSPIADDPSFIVFEDRTDEDSPRVNYFDLGADGVSTQVADQEEAPSHSGVVSFDSNTYKIADTVTITLEDLDLNTDSDLIDIYTTVTDADDQAYGTVGKNDLPEFSFGPLGRLLDITFDDVLWATPDTDNDGDTSDETCGKKLKDANISDTGLTATGFTLIETDVESGVFVGDFQIPSQWCRLDTTDTTAPFTWKDDPETTTGLDIEVNYVDFRDASGEIIEVGDSAGIRANTGSVSLDRTVYPVPFGVPTDFKNQSTDQDDETTPSGRSIFPIHQTGISDSDDDTSDGAGIVLDDGEFIKNGDLTIHVRVNDPDWDVSASGEDLINRNSTSGVGPVKVSVIRGSNSVILGHAGGPEALDGPIVVGSADAKQARQFGPMEEIAPDAGIFESDIVIRYTDGPQSELCPETTVFENLKGGSGTSETDRFSTDSDDDKNYCILQGDILQVEYTDPEDASGDPNTVTDSATFDLRNGVLQSDKSVYIIGSDMILTLIEPDFDLDNDQAETYDLDLIEWDSDAATITMGDKGGEAAAFDPEPTDFRETGDSTGIFQTVVEIPEELKNDRLERGEEIVLEYTDWGPSGSDYVGDEDEDVNLTIYTSNFGATVELDQKVYTWTDKVYITIVAPDHNFDSDLIDEIGDTDLDPIKISTRGFNLDKYKLVETGTDTGIFTGEVILTGFKHDADGDSTTGDSDGFDTNPRTSGSGPTDGFLQADDDDGITVSFEFSEDETVVGSALIRWNIGEVQWLEASYPASGTGVVRVIDPDMNLDPEAVDNFDVDVWSDSDAGGIDLTVTETNEATGIFEGTVFFTTTDESSGHRLRVAEGDTVTAEYEDNTLPDPYTRADELDISATSLIGTVVPPLERAPAANLRTVDAFGNSLDTVAVDQQVQITADLANGQDREQAFAYLVQIQDANGVTVSLAWITGSLSAGQSFSPALSWIPTETGTYTATAFVWESVDNPTALSPPVSTTITVQ